MQHKCFDKFLQLPYQKHTLFVDVRACFGDVVGRLLFCVWGGEVVLGDCFGCCWFMVGRFWVKCWQVL